MEYQGYIFDCDGTLTDSMPLHFVAWRDTLARYEMVFPEERFYSMAGMPTTKILEILSAEQDISIDIALVSKQKEQAFVDLIPQVQPIESVLEKVRNVHGKKPVSVASGGNRETVMAQLTALGVTELFEIVVTAEDTERHKPEPDVFLKAAELMQVEPNKCCVYEDSDLGIQAARSANMGWVDVREFHQPKRVTV